MSSIDYVWGVSNPSQNQLVQTQYPSLILTGTETLGITTQIVEVGGALWYVTNALWNASLNGFTQQNAALGSSATVLFPSGTYQLKQTGTNAANPIVWTTTSLLSLQTGYLNVMSYGATGNGTTDDTAAIQSALNAAKGQGGAEVYFPAGTYLISSPLTVYAGTALVGAGYPQTLFSCTGTTLTGGVFLSNTTAGANGFSYSNFGVNFPSNATAGSVFSFIGTNYNYIANVGVGNGWNDVTCSGTIGTFIDNLSTSKTFRPGNSNTCDSIYLTNNATETHLTNCILGTTGAGSPASCRSGVNAEYQQQLVMVGCDIQQFQYGLYVVPLAGKPSYNSFVSNSVFDFSYAAGIYFSCTTATSNAYTWTFNNCWSGGSQGYGIWLNNASTGNIDNINFNSHFAINCQNHGVVITNCTNISFQNSVSSSNGQNSVACGVTVTGSTDVVIQNNRMGNVGYGYTIAQSYAAFWDNTNTRLIFQNNDCSGNTVGPIQSAVTSVATSYRIRNNNGYNPYGHVASPTFVLGTALVNPFAIDAMVIVSGGTLTGISIGGTATGQTSGTFRLPAGQSMTLAGTVLPTTTWFLD